MKFKNQIIKIGSLVIWNIFFLIFIFLSWTSILHANIDTAIKPTLAHSSQCIKIIRTLEKKHYLEKNLDDKMSLIIFESYLKRLDPNKHLFTIKDIDLFRQYQFLFDDKLKKGRLNTAFEIFDLYMERSKERLEFILSMIKEWEKKIDLNKNESLVIDTDSLPWRSDRQALYSIWKKELKNHIISLILDDQDNASISKTLDRIYSTRLKRLLQTNSNDIFHVFINSVTTSFDPHTQFFPPRASQDFDIQMSLSLEGIGAVLQTEYEYTKVVRLIPKGPADKSNLLMPGDKIIGVGQGETGEIQDTIGQRIDHVVKLIRGPKNSFVRLKIIPVKKKNSTRTIQIKRERITLEEQSAQKKTINIFHNNKSHTIGIIEIPNFYIDFNAYYKGDKNYKSTTKDVKKLLVQLKKENIDGLIIDLRDNGGGSLQEANQLTGLFIKSGPVVQVKSKYKMARLYDKDPSIAYSGPLIVLINRMSASASEIFAGAIKDYHRGVIVGTRSFGKGTVQELTSLGKGKLKLTSAKFYRISGKSTQNLGIIPDLRYPQTYKIEDTGESSLDGALPWDATIRAFYNSYPELGNINKKLKLLYQRRSVKDFGLKYLNKRVEMISELNSQTPISLNLNDRKARKKRYEQLELEIENDYLKSINKKPIEQFDKENMETGDLKKILMDQTHLVMADFIDLSNEFDFSW